MTKLALVNLSLSFAAALAGCSEPEPVNQTHDGELTDSDPRVEQDNSPYDTFEFDADEGWTITAEMDSTAFDSYVWLFVPNGAPIQNDDAEGRGTNSRITLVAPERGRYSVRANSYDGTGRGAYQVRITAGPGAAPALSTGPPAPAPAPTPGPAPEAGDTAPAPPPAPAAPTPSPTAPASP